jgi:hypothetical protein
VEASIGAGVVQTSKFEILFQTIWDAPHNYLRCPSLTTCKALSNIFARHKFVGVLKGNFAASFLAMTMHCTSSSFD